MTGSIDRFMTYWGGVNDGVLRQKRRGFLSWATGFSVVDDGVFLSLFIRKGVVYVAVWHVLVDPLGEAQLPFGGLAPPAATVGNRADIAPSLQLHQRPLNGTGPPAGLLHQQFHTRSAVGAIVVSVACEPQEHALLIAGKEQVTDAIHQAPAHDRISASQTAHSSSIASKYQRCS